MENNPSITRGSFGTLPDGTEIDQYILSAGSITAKIITLGGIVSEIWTPDRDGNRSDVVLGFSTLDPYVKGHPFFGTLTGRVANRIAKGRFTLDGKEYKLAINNGPNTLHGGLKGFDKVVWKVVEATAGSDSARLVLSYYSYDGEEGFPGNLSVKVTYSVTRADELKIEYLAQTDKATPINLTSHSYFNLAGEGSGDVLTHELNILARSYTPVDETLIPTGKLLPVKGTPFDFTEAKSIGRDIGAVSGGFDHNFVLTKSTSGELSVGAKVFEPTSGRTMEFWTSEPGVQFYTGNFLDGSLTGKSGGVYGKHAGFCLEAQHFPDSVNHPSFPSTILRPGKSYQQETIYKFGVRH